MMPFARFAPLAALTLVAACSRTPAENEKVADFHPHTETPTSATPSAASAPASTGRAASASATSASDAGSRGPTNVEEVLAQLNPKPKREPDWDLDTSDPGRDYVLRYVRATQRYGEQTWCVAVGKSVMKNGMREVRVTDDPKSKCGGTSEAERDVFVVDVAGDHIAVDDPSKRAPLRRWMDGSDPEGPPAPLQQINDLRQWKSPLKGALDKLKLSAIRAQFYGRGTYPVLTLAGWNPIGITKEQPPDTLVAAANTFCEATNNRPLAMFGGLDRTLLLKVRCPTTADGKAYVVWEKL